MKKRVERREREREAGREKTERVNRTFLKIEFLLGK